jgi:hypothetical protein
VILFLAALNVFAQGTAISYQGQLSVSGSPANTNYDFRFGVFTAVTNGSMVSSWVTNSALPVSNGLFTATLNFGPGIFNGTANGSNDWLEIGVRTVGGGGFMELTPRQPILPVPYALFATSASNLLGSLAATQLVGSLGSTGLSGTYSNTVSFVNGTNTFTGTFTGNGANLTNLNASSVATGTLSDARLSNDVAFLDVNQTFTASPVFGGATVAFHAATTLTGTNTFAGPVISSGANGFSGINVFTNNGNYFVGSFFGNGLVGWLPVNGPSTNAMRDAGYLLLNWGLSTVTLPSTASLSVGDIVRASGAGGGGWLIKENSGQSIVGNFASYGNCLPAPSLVTGVTYSGVAASADGVHLFAVGTGFTGINASSDSGHTWTPLSAANISSGYYLSVACSANGKIVYAEPTGTTTDIMKSTDGGTTWSATTTLATGNAIATSADGSKLFTSNYACSGNGNFLGKLSGGSISISTNGSTFGSTITAPGSMSCLGVSSDCTRMVAGVSGGLLYATSDQGLHWTTLTTTNQYWTGAWMSPDGSKFAASFSGGGNPLGGVFSASVSALPNTSTTTSTGTLCGSQGSAVELQYIGNGQFMPVGGTGLLWAN